MFIDAAAPDPPPILINPNPVLPPAVPIFKAPVVCVVEIPTSTVFPDAFNDGETIDPPVTAPDAVTVTPEIAPADVIAAV